MVSFEEIKIRYIRDIEPLEYIGGEKHSNAVDLRCGEDTYLCAGEYKVIPLGVAMQLPAGYEAHMYPRSSTFKRYGVIFANSVGIIDESYCGDNDEWGFPAYAVRDTFIPKGERIAQFEIVRHQPTIKFVAVEKLGNESRGGFGSTGSK